MRFLALLLAPILALPGPLGAGVGDIAGCSDVRSCCCVEDNGEPAGALLEPDCCCEIAPAAPGAPSPPRPQRDRAADEAPGKPILTVVASAPPRVAAPPRLGGIAAPRAPRAPPLDVLRRTCVLLS